MNLNRILQSIGSQKVHGSASVTFPVAKAEFYVEMLPLDEYQRLLDSEGVSSVICAFAADGIAHEVCFRILSDTQEFQLSF